MDALQGFAPFVAGEHVWNGCFKSFEECNEIMGASNLFDNETWSNFQQTEITEITTKESYVSSGGSTLGSFLVGYVRQNPNYSIIDFGGGAALEYSKLMKFGLTPPHHFRVIEVDKVAALVNNLSLDTVVAETSLPSDRDFCVFHAGSSLQYVEDPSTVFDFFANHITDAVVLSGLLAGNVPDMVTAQHSYGKWQPVRFFNVSNFKLKMEKIGFNLSHAAPAVTRYFGKIQAPPMSNFPKNLVLDSKLDLIFTR